MKVIKYIIICLCFHLNAQEQTVVLPELIEKTRKKIEELKVIEPNQVDPLSLNGTIIWADDKSQLALVLKAKVLDNWHIYAYVPADQPYINSNLKLELPEGINKIDDWEKPPIQLYEHGIFVYKNELVFIHYLNIENCNPKDIIKAGLFYQACDPNMCLPPKTKIKEFSLAHIN